MAIRNRLLESTSPLGPGIRTPTQKAPEIDLGAPEIGAPDVSTAPVSKTSGVQTDSGVILPGLGDVGAGRNILNPQQSTRANPAGAPSEFGTAVTPLAQKPAAETSTEALAPKVQPISDTETISTAPPTPAAPATLTIPEPDVSEVKETFQLVDPETGETTDFDDKIRFDKARANQAKQIEEAKILKEERGITDDLITSGLQLVKDVVEGNDPVKTAQFNWAIQQMNPLFQAKTAATALRLKQAGIDPNAPGAGQAIMTQMARQSGQKVSDIVNQLNVESAQRMIELTKWGVDKSMDVQKHRQQQRVDDWNFGVAETTFLANTLKTADPGDYDDVFASMNLPVGVDTGQFIQDIQSQNALDNSAANRTLTADYQNQRAMFNSLMPGVAYDQTAMSGLTTDEYADVLSRAQNIGNALSKGPSGKEEAKALLLEAQKLYPNVFDIDYSGWDPDDFNSLDVFNKQQGLRTALSQQVFVAGTDAFSLTEASQWAATNLIDPLTVDTKFDAMWETMNDSQKDRILELAGLDAEPLTAEEKRLALGAEQVRGTQDTSNPTQRLFDVFYQSSSTEFKNWLQADPTNEDTFKQYLFQLSTGGAVSIGPDGNLVIDSRQLLDPTNPDSKIAHYYMDWPMATDIEGNWVEPENWGVTEGTYAGNQPITDSNMSADKSDYQDQLNQKWENYVNSGGKKSRMEWFTDGEGGTKKVSFDIGDEALDPEIEDLLKDKVVSPLVKDIVSGDKNLADLGANELKSFVGDDLTVLHDSHGVKAYHPGGTSTLPDMQRSGSVTEWASDNGIIMAKTSDSANFQAFAEGQLVIVGGNVYELDTWNSTGTGSERQSWMVGRNLKTGKLEKFAQWGSGE